MSLHPNPKPDPAGPNPGPGSRLVPRAWSLPEPGASLSGSDPGTRKPGTERLGFGFGCAFGDSSRA